MRQYIVQGNEKTGETIRWLLSRGRQNIQTIIRVATASMERNRL